MGRGMNRTGVGNGEEYERDERGCGERSGEMARGMRG